MKQSEITVTFIGDRWMASYLAFQMTADTIGSMLDFNGNPQEENYAGIRRAMQGAIIKTIGDHATATAARIKERSANSPPLTATITGPLFPTRPVQPVPDATIPPMNSSTLAWALRDGMQNDIWFDADDDSTVWKQIVDLQEHIERAAAILDHHDEVVAALAEMRTKYGRLHDFVSDCVEEGRINLENLPDDYQAIVEALCACLDADKQAEDALANATKGQA